VGKNVSGGGGGKWIFPLVLGRETLKSACFGRRGFRREGDCQKKHERKEKRATGARLNGKKVERNGFNEGKKDDILRGEGGKTPQQGQTGENQDTRIGRGVTMKEKAKTLDNTPTEENAGQGFKKPGGHNLVQVKRHAHKGDDWGAHKKHVINGNPKKINRTGHPLWN